MWHRAAASGARPEQAREAAFYLDFALVRAVPQAAASTAKAAAKIATPPPGCPKIDQRIKRVSWLTEVVNKA
jgi:hypothetical protein